VIHLCSFDKSFFPLEGEAVLHAVNHDVVHSVELSRCHGIVAITVGGLTPPSAVLTDSVCWIVVGCAPFHVCAVLCCRPVMSAALLSRSYIQEMDGDLGSNTHSCSNGDDAGS
jgi:hypothetical protein